MLPENYTRRNVRNRFIVYPNCKDMEEIMEIVLEMSDEWQKLNNKRIMVAATRYRKLTMKLRQRLKSTKEKAQLIRKKIRAGVLL